MFDMWGRHRLASGCPLDGTVGRLIAGTIPGLRTLQCGDFDFDLHAWVLPDQPRSSWLPDAPLRSTGAVRASIAQTRRHSVGHTLREQHLQGLSRLVAVRIRCSSGIARFAGEDCLIWTWLCNRSLSCPKRKPSLRRPLPGIADLLFKSRA